MSKRKHRKQWIRLGMLIVLTTEVVLIGTVLGLQRYGASLGGTGPDGISPGDMDTDTAQTVQYTDGNENDFFARLCSVFSYISQQDIEIDFPSLHPPDIGAAFPRLYIPDLTLTFTNSAVGWGGETDNHTENPDEPGEPENLIEPGNTNEPENPDNTEPEPEPEHTDSEFSEPEKFFVQAGNIFTSPEELIVDESLPVIEYTPVSYTGKIPVLMYHHVVRDGEPFNEMCVTVSRLETDLQWLINNGYHTVLPYELATGTPLPDKPVLITFDDGYVSNYELLYPLLQRYQLKAVISVIVCMVENASMPENANSSFLNWEMCREMIASGLVEIGSHTYQLHNAETNGMFNRNGANGIQRRADESDESYRQRVLNDIRKSYEVITAHTGQPPAFFAYPFGKADPDADALIRQLFPVSVITREDIPNLQDGLQQLPRLTVMMDEPLKHLIERVDRKR